jgi:hypothetical protein
VIVGIMDIITRKACDRYLRMKLSGSAAVS